MKNEYFITYCYEDSTTVLTDFITGVTGEEAWLDFIENSYSTLQLLSIVRL